MEDLEKWLSTFFCYVSQLCFDKTKELLDRERETGRPGFYKQLFAQLGSFVEAEKSYFNLGFLSTKNKMFLRKEVSLKSLYESLRTEVHKIEELYSGDPVFISISPQYFQFLSARRDLITLYEQIYNSGSYSKHIKYEELQSQIEVIIDKYKYSFTHNVLMHIKMLFNWETEILINMFGAQIAIQNWNLVSATMHIHLVHNLLSQWEKSLQSKETWKLGFLKGNQLPHLYQWLLRLKCGVVNKFTFYFYQTLSLQAQDMKNYISARHNTDLIQKFQNLQRKCFASYVLLVFDPKGLHNWTGPGYHHPSRPKEHYEHHIIMNAHPNKNIEKMATISKILSERSTSAMEPEKVMFFESQEICTYFMFNIDPRVTLVVVFDGRKEDRDPNLNRHMLEFCDQVRCTGIFASLKISK